jgi:hypothetical protein
VSNLESIQARWIELFDRLRCDPRTKDQIAPPFFSVPAVQARSILYVGKATAKDGCWDEAPSGSTQTQIKQGIKYTNKFLIEVAPEINSGFWHFARELNTEVAKKWKQQVTSPFQHIAWTNVCKIGELGERPPREAGIVFRAQQELAVETLRLEIELYKPGLICFVTWDYAWELVKEVIGDPSDASWDQAENEQWLWCHRPTHGLPAILLTGHPGRKSRALRETWLTKASDLLPD